MAASRSGEQPKHKIIHNFNANCGYSAQASRAAGARQGPRKLPMLNNTRTKRRVPDCGARVCECGCRSSVMKFGYAWTFVNKPRGETPAPPPEKRAPELPRRPGYRPSSELALAIVHLHEIKPASWRYGAASRRLRASSARRISSGCHLPSPTIFKLPAIERTW